VAKPNYRQARRAVDQAKKKKQEEKRLRKLERKNAPQGENQDLIETAAAAPEAAPETGAAPAPEA